MYLTHHAPMLLPVGVGKKDVVTICVDELAMEGFKLLEEKKVSALAVVNNDGQIVGEMDSNSLKMIGTSALQRVEFLHEPTK